MIDAVIIAMIIMFVFSSVISAFIHKYPTLKILALSFLLMSVLSLVIEGWSPDKAHELDLKDYIYFVMVLSFFVQLLNMTMLKRQNKKRIVRLNEPFIEDKNENDSDKAV